MNIVILHRIHFEKIRYDNHINHAEHNITYFCLKDKKGDIPQNINAKIIEISHDQYKKTHLIDHYSDIFSACNILIARSEYDLIVASELREYFTIKGKSVAQSLAIRDKFTMRELIFQSKNIKQPKYWSIFEFVKSETTTSHYVLKPKLGASSENIYIGNYDDITTKIKQLQLPERFFVEEFCKGEIYHVDGFIAKGTIHCAIESRYVNTCFDYTKGKVLGSYQVASSPKTLSLVTECLKTLDYIDGSFHYEGIIRPNGDRFFLELGGRVGGAGVAETFERKTGLNLYKLDILSQIYDEYRPQESKICNDFFGWFVYPNTGGQLYQVSFDTQKWQTIFCWHEINHSPLKNKMISYSKEHSPFSGVIKSSEDNLQDILHAFIKEVKVEEII